MKIDGHPGFKKYKEIACGELGGETSATQMPAVACDMVMFSACEANSGNVYIGGSGVTVKDATTDTTTGLELDAGASTGWVPVGNMNILYYICDNAGDDFTYLAMVS